MTMTMTVTVHIISISFHINSSLIYLFLSVFTTLGHIHPWVHQSISPVLSRQDLCSSASFSQGAHLDVSSGAIPASSEMPLLWRTLPPVTSPPGGCVHLTPRGKSVKASPSLTRFLKNAKRQKQYPAGFNVKHPDLCVSHFGSRLEVHARLLTFLFADRPRAN